MKALSRILIAMGCVLLFSLNQTTAQCISTFPYTQDFENFTTISSTTSCSTVENGDTADGWTQAQNDFGEWRADSAGTPSYATGPGSTSSTQGNMTGKDFMPGRTDGIYMYIESSGNTCANQSITLISPCFDFSGNSTYRLKFGYFIAGGGQGSLHVDVLDSNVWVTDVWVLSGHQKYEWDSASVILAPFNKSNTQIRFRAVMGETWTSDIAIDGVKIEKYSPLKNNISLVEIMDTARSYFHVTPKHQKAINYSLRIKNNGSDQATSMSLTARSGTWSHTQSLGNLAPYRDSTFALSSSFTPSSASQGEITFTLSMNQSDQDTSDNVMVLKTGMSDSVLGPASAIPAGAIGVNGSGQMGQVIELSTADTLTAVQYFLVSPVSGDSVRVHVYEFNSGSPGNLITSSAHVTINGGGWYTTTFDCDEPLTAGQYLVAVEQVLANNMALGSTIYGYGANSSWFWNGVNWVDLGVGTDPYPYAMMVRMVFGKINRPTPKIESNDSFCQGQKLVIKGTGGDTYQWSPSANVQFPKNPSTTAQSDTNFSLSLKAWDACGIPSKTVSKNIKVNPKPKGKTIADTAICLGQSITLTASGGTSYTWAGGPKNTSWTVTPTSSESYQVIFDSTNGCRLILNPRVTVQNLQISAMGDTTVCSGTSVQISASGADTYTWVPGGTGASKTVSPSQTTQYVVTGTSSIGCKDNDTVTVSVNQAPDIVLPHDTIVCFGRRFEVEAAGADSFQWLDGPSTAKYSILPILSKYFYVEGFNNNGCSSSDSMYVVVAPVPQVKLREDTVICEETVLELEALTSNQVEFSWSTGDTTRKINVSPKSETTFKVLVKNNGNCSDSAEVTIGVNPLPVINFVTELEQGKFTATNSSLHVDEHKWVFGDGEESNNKSPFHKYQDTGTYFVTYTATNNCGSVDTTFRLDNYWVGVANVQPHLNFKVYPQPANNRLEIKLENSGISELNIQLFDMNGKLILERNNTQLESGYTSIDISNVSVGSYVLRLSNKHRIGRKMILIK